MCYGRGLDSKWGGDPTGQHMTADDIKNGIKSCGNIPPEKLMLAWSWQSTQEKEFVAMIKELGSLATAGCYAWCKGNIKCLVIILTVMDHVRVVQLGVEVISVIE